MERIDAEKNPLAELSNMVLPVGQDEIEAFFNIGVRLYRSAQFKIASKFFLFVCIARPSNASYLCAYGKSIKMSNNFKIAAAVFQMAFLLDKHRSEYAVHAAECLLHCGKYAQAKLLLEIATNDPVLAAKHQSIYEKAGAWLELIQSDQNCTQ